MVKRRALVASRRCRGSVTPTSPRTFCEGSRETPASARACDDASGSFRRWPRWPPMAKLVSIPSVSLVSTKPRANGSCCASEPTICEVSASSSPSRKCCSTNSHTTSVRNTIASSMLWSRPSNASVTRRRRSSRLVAVVSAAPAVVACPNLLHGNNPRSRLHNPLLGNPLSRQCRGRRTLDRPLNDVLSCPERARAHQKPTSSQPQPTLVSIPSRAK
mmetsp:Transcript_3548/g.9117  ORF Transcript_3548/g.9117 Transcript_3548/m.9117 type:complete len:217 (-) Transcript_3548:400-1050(-)